MEDYLAFLKLGASQSPEALLAVAGVDPLDAETYQRGLDFFSEMVDEYERLVDAKLEQNSRKANVDNRQVKSRQRRDCFQAWAALCLSGFSSAV